MLSDIWLDVDKPNSINAFPEIVKLFAELSSTRLFEPSWPAIIGAELELIVLIISVVVIGVTTGCAINCTVASAKPSASAPSCKGVLNVITFVALLYV